MACYVCEFDRYKDSRIAIKSIPGEDSEIVECPRCGKYTISETTKATLKSREGDFDLSAYIRHSNLFFKKPVDLDSDTYMRISNELPYQYSVSEKLRHLLKSVAMMSKNPSDIVRLNFKADMVLAFAKDESEFTYYIEALRDRNLLKKGTLDHAIITPKGWDILENNRHNSATSDQGFVAMSFSSSMESIYNEAIKPAITEAGYKPYRVDEDKRPEKIDAKILAEIRRSRFLVADVTEQNNGAYYEAGYAQGLGIPVIWSVKEENLNDVHFDARQYRFILWQDLAALKKELKEVILGFIGKGPISG